MIDADVRNAIYQLHLAGTALRDISRQFQVSRNAVRQIIRQQGALSRGVRKDKIHIDPDLLRRLYDQCGGWAQRMHEKLVEEEKMALSYSTLTRLLRELNIGSSSSTRHDRVPDEPGAEMQHDTTVYRLKLGGDPTRVVASLLYLRYCKRRYLRFYRVFHRFAMKCFLHEALMDWAYSAHTCIIDNTNLARLRGTGKQAVIVPEMEAFAKRYGTQFVCHELGHANRKAGVERGFWGVESNFLPGRVFGNLEDLNAQAREWATVRMHHRPVAKTGLIPAKAFEHARRLRRKRAQMPEMFELETFPFTRQPKLDRQRIRSLYDSFDYMTKRQNIIWLGPTGCGKTGLATGFLLQAMDRGYRGYFITFAELVAKLYASLADHSQQKLIRKFTSYDALVIDEVGYAEVEAAQVGLFFTLMQRRHKTKTTLITSNLGFSEWGSFLKNPQLTSALLDRLTETSHVIHMKKCRSLRDPLDGEGDGEPSPA